MRGAIIKHALDAYAQPSKLRQLSTGQIPQDVLLLIKVAARDSATLQEIATLELGSIKTVQEACVLLLRAFISGAGNNDKRVLLLPTGASFEDFKNHKRWLLKWLHPDLNNSTWDTNLFRRISGSAKAIELEWTSAIEDGSFKPNIIARPPLVSHESERHKATRIRIQNQGRLGRGWLKKYKTYQLRQSRVWYHNLIAYFALAVVIFCLFATALDFYTNSFPFDGINNVTISRLATE